ncbi:MAG TPA: fibronectin type III domain-containing protein, partial [Longimicrobium sp.]|nr:fibronectin type III domain-containing protein [Longimicrobium sp.]
TGRATVRAYQITGSSTMSPDSGGLAPAGTMTWGASFLDLDGFAAPSGGSRWRSSNAAVATIDSLTGFTTGVSEGTALIIVERHLRQPEWFYADSAFLLVIATPTITSGTSLTTGPAAQQGIYINFTDASSTETGYQVERNVNGGAFTTRATTAANAVQFFDVKSGLINGATYGYRIRACNANGCGAASNTVFVVS